MGSVAPDTRLLMLFPPWYGVWARSFPQVKGIEHPPGCSGAAYDQTARKTGLAQDLANLARQGVGREGLLEERGFRVEEALARDGGIGMAGDE